MADEATASARAALEALVEAGNRGDADAVAARCAEDTIWAPAGGAEVKGKARVAAACREVFEAFEPRVAFECEAVSSSGAQALVKGRASGELRRRDGGTPRAVSERFVAVLRWEDGAWLVAGLAWEAVGGAEGIDRR
jgi:ketosteroid isomerase-like protein